MPEPKRKEEFTPSKELEEVAAQVEAIEQQIKAQQNVTQSIEMDFEQSLSSNTKLVQVP